jgi:hypothetical protein
MICDPFFFPINSDVSIGSLGPVYDVKSLIRLGKISKQAATGGSARQIQPAHHATPTKPTTAVRPRSSSTRPRPILSPFRPSSSIGRSIMKEIVHIQAGQCGNQIGAKFWEVRKPRTSQSDWMDDPRVAAVPAASTGAREEILPASRDGYGTNAAEFHVARCRSRSPPSDDCRSVAPLLDRSEALAVRQQCCGC